MYDPHAVLAALDANKTNVLIFCGLAMVFNYIWFYLALRKGFKDQVFPMPITCTLFWLCGDGTGVFRYDMYFNQYGHWYLELFWAALVFTVSFEICFIWSTLKFGRKELLPDWSQTSFNLLMLGAAAVFGVTWNMVLGSLADDLNMIYFNIANMTGPIAMAGLVLRRKSAVGTSSTIWILYTLMLMSWYFAMYNWFGPAFRTPGMVAVMLVNIAAAAGLAAYIRQLEKAPEGAAQAA